MKKNSGIRAFFNVSLYIYILMVLYITLLNREPSEQKYSFDLFYSYILLFKDKNDFYYDMILYNILMLIPFGFLVPVLHPKCRNFLCMLILSFLFSLAIEVTQFVTRRGVFEVDDLLNNTVGGIIGYFIYFILSSIFMALFRRKKQK